MDRGVAAVRDGLSYRTKWFGCPIAGAEYIYLMLKLSSNAGSR